MKDEPQVPVTTLQQRRCLELSVHGGVVTFMFPDPMDHDDFVDVRDLLVLCLKGIERRASAAISRRGILICDGWE